MASKEFDPKQVRYALRIMESIGYRFYWALYRDRSAYAGKAKGLVVHDRMLTGARSNVRALP